MISVTVMIEVTVATVVSDGVYFVVGMGGGMAGGGLMVSVWPNVAGSVVDR